MGKLLLTLVPSMLYHFFSSYPPRYIYSQFIKFFSDQLRNMSTLPWIDTVHDFQFIQACLLNRATLAESQMASRIANAMKSNDENITGNLIAKPAIEKESKWDKNLIIHYTHESRFTILKRDIHQLWNEMLKNPITNDIRFIIGHRNNPK